MHNMDTDKSIPLSAQSPMVWAAYATGGMVVIALAFIYLEINLLDMFRALPSFLSFFANNFMPPDFAAIPKYVHLLFETVFFAVVGTCISSILALVGGLLLSERTNSIKAVRQCVRAILSFLRNIPVLVWAALLIYIFGIGSMVGLLALILATLGFLSRSYAESLNELAEEKLEAMQAVGASKAQILVHGILPEFVPSWINWTLFTFELNMRASMVLGMVGAGGIGIMIQTNLRHYRYREALALIIVLVMIILATEFMTNRIRKRII